MNQLLKKISQKLRLYKISFFVKILKFISQLQRRKAVFEFSEFTWDMVRGLPRAYFYENNNINYNVFVKKGLKETYFFSKNVFELNFFHDLNPLETYKSESPSFTLSHWEPPPLMELFKNVNFNFDKEVVIIQNKYSVEWCQKPFNFFDIDTLTNLFSTLKNDYQIVYIRPESISSNGYYQDKNEILDFQDYNLIKEKFPEVYIMTDLFSSKENYNICQFKIHAQSLKHICVSGGNACISSYFGGEVLIFDSSEGKKREIWETNSWLKELSGSKIIGFDDKNDLVKYVKNNW